VAIRGNNKSTTDSVNATIGANYSRSGSAIVATTQAGSGRGDTDSATVAIRDNYNKSRQRHGDNREQQRGTSPVDTGTTTQDMEARVDSVIVTINNYDMDSANVAIRNNNESPVDTGTTATDRQSQHDHRSPTAINRQHLAVRFPSLRQGGGSSKTTTYRNPRSGSQSVQADSHSKRPLHPIHSAGRSGEFHLHATSYY
jgi:hypothetical protein